MKPECTLTATIKARPEKREEVLTLLRGFVDKSRAEHGCVNYDLHVSSDDSNVFFFYENWETMEAWREHSRLPYQQEWGERHAELLEEPPTLAFYEMLSDPA